MDKRYKLPAVTWLRVTGYMHAWLEHEMGGDVRAHGKRVLSVQHLRDARGVLRMETKEDILDPGPANGAMSATRMNVVDAGLRLDASATERLYGISRKDLELYVPIECPKMCLTKNGVLRPWTLDVCFGKKQTPALRKLLQEEFWQAVEGFDGDYAEEMMGTHYAAVRMITAFCQETKTPEMYIEEIRREWQRREKRKRDKKADKKESDEVNVC